MTYSITIRYTYDLNFIVQQIGYLSAFSYENNVFSNRHLLFKQMVIYICIGLLVYV